MNLPKLSEVDRVSLSLSVATGLYGISFGALAIAAGLAAWQAITLSLLMFTGGSQFAFIGVIAGGGTPIAALSAASLVGVRNAIYGMQTRLYVRPQGWRKLLAIHVSIDESIAVSTSQKDPDLVKRGFWMTGLGVYLFWNLCTVIGVYLGNSIGDPKVWGLDGAAVAAFIGLLWPRLVSREPVALAIVCAAVTIIAVPFVPAGIPIIIAAFVAGIWSWRCFVNEKNKSSVLVDAQEAVDLVEPREGE